MIDLAKFNLKKNHTINLVLLALGALLITYNHFAAAGWAATPIRLEEFAPLAPMFLQWWNAIQAGHAESTRFITPAQAIVIMEMAAERSVDARRLAEGAFNKTLDQLTRREASQLIANHLKPLGRKDGAL